MKRFTHGHSCYRWDKFKEESRQGKYIIPNEIEDLVFIRCPYCGDPLDKDMECYINIELDTLHYKETRLRKFIKILETYGEIMDQLRTSSFWLINLKCKGDGDKISKSLTRGYWEIKSAYDKRHDRWTLS